jgi:hypothetical protein
VLEHGAHCGLRVGREALVAELERPDPALGEPAKEIACASLSARSTWTQRSSGRTAPGSGTWARKSGR